MYSSRAAVLYAATSTSTSPERAFACTSSHVPVWRTATLMPRSPKISFTSAAPAPSISLPLRNITGGHSGCPDAIAIRASGLVGFELSHAPAATAHEIRRTRVRKRRDIGSIVQGYQLPPILLHQPVNRPIRLVARDGGVDLRHEVDERRLT